MKTGKSDFGRGLVICLVKFAKHRHSCNADSFFLFDKWIRATPDDRKNMLSANPVPSLDYGFPYMKYLKVFVEIADEVYNHDYEGYLSHEIETFMNGASDHLYDIQVPKGKDWNLIRAKVQKLQKKAIRMGHGFIPKAKWTLQDVQDVFEEVDNIALMIDKKIGLKTDRGEWE